MTLLEGSLIWDKAEELSQSNRWFIGQNMYAVFNRLTDQLPEGERPEFLQPIEDILDGKITEGIREHRLGEWFKEMVVDLANSDQMTNGIAHVLYHSIRRRKRPWTGQQLV